MQALAATPEHAPRVPAGLRAHTIPTTTRAAIARTVRTGLEGLRAQPPMRLGDWAAKHFVLAGESSHQRGGWEAWPFQVGILDWMGDDDIHELDVLKSKRVGYTKMLVASIAFDAVYRRRNQAIWQPTDDDRDSFVKSEIEPMMAGVPAVANSRPLNKGAEDSLKLKQFRGCVAHLLGGKAARAYRRITVAAVKLDELSAFDRQIEKSADAWTLAWGRLEGAPFPKGICGSTPRIKGIDQTEHRADQADVFMRYRITCPHCGVEHPLTFGDRKSIGGLKRIVDAHGAIVGARHQCPHCLGSITQAQYLANWHGAWVCEKTGARYGADRTWRNADGQPIKPPGHVAVHVWSVYSPQRDWLDILREHAIAHANSNAQHGQ
jgi:phage terminase large subunit GpA-like protein